MKPRDARTPILSRPCEVDAGIRGGRSRPCLLCARRFSGDSVLVDGGRLASKAICALRCEVENGIHVLQRPYASNFAKVPGKSQLYIIVEQHEMKTREQSNIFFFGGRTIQQNFFFFWEGSMKKKFWIFLMKGFFSRKTSKLIKTQFFLLLVSRKNLSSEKSNQIFFFLHPPPEKNL